MSADSSTAAADADARLWAALPIPAILFDADDCITDINPAGEGFLNTSARAIRGAPLWQRLNPGQPVDRAVQRARDSQTPLFVNDVQLAVGARAPVACNLQVAPMGGQTGAMLLLISPRELAEMMTRGHHATSAAKSAIGMAEMLAHEIKNPLAGITGAAQLLSMNLGPEDRELTALIVAESHRIVKLLDQVEQFGDLRPPELGPVNLHDVLDRARRSALLGFAAEMRIIEEFDPSLPLARGDADQLVQVVLNLLRNAAQAAGPKGGTIRLRSYYEHAFRLRRADGPGLDLPLQIEVIDDGPGVPPDLADDIFEPFVSGRPNGTGLGLALVSKIIAQHNGWITLDSRPGHTVVRLSLPMAKGAAKTKETG